MRQVEFAATRYGQGSAKLSAGVRHHEIDALRSGFLSRHDEITFVFTVFVIHYYHEFSFAEVSDRFLNGVESYLFHISGGLLSLQFMYMFDFDMSVFLPLFDKLYFLFAYFFDSGCLAVKMAYGASAYQI